MKCYSKSLPPVSFQFLAARCRCPWATLTPRSHSGQPRRIHAFRRSTPIQPRRVESMPMGTSRYFVRKTTIPPPKRPRRIHVSPCHDTPILFGDEVKRCPWGHLGNIMRTSDIPPPLGLEESMAAHAAIFVRELLKKLRHFYTAATLTPRRTNGSPRKASPFSSTIQQFLSENC